MVLIQVMVMVMILAIISSALLYLTYNRRIAVAQERNSFQARFWSEGAYNRAMECLTKVNVNNCTFPVGATCSAPCGSVCSTFFPGPLVLAGMSGAESVSLTLSGAPPCTLTVVCNNCLW